jgi:hypothetical protein
MAPPKCFWDPWPSSTSHPDRSWDTKEVATMGFSSVGMRKPWFLFRENTSIYRKYTGWWYTYPSEKYESQLGRILP